MWTRHRLRRYWVGQVTGPWRYDRSPDSIRYDLYNVRPCQWLDQSYRDYEVPGAAVRSFTAGERHSGGSAIIRRRSGSAR